MKRSNMVERIYDLLNCDGVLEYSMPKLEPVPLTEEHVRWIAEQIVQEVERGGMLPPPKKTDTVTSYLVYCYYPEVTGDDKDQLDITNSQLWEPENE